MSFLPLSKLREAVQASGRGRLLVHTFTFALVGVLLLTTGCKDDLEPPTLGTLSVSVTELNAGAAEGSAITIEHSGGMDFFSASETILARYPDGETVTLTIVPDSDCAEVSPQTVIEAQIVAGETTETGWSIKLGSPLRVESEPVGAVIWVDGQDTGLTTPASVPCQTIGEHTVRIVGGVGFEGEATETIMVGPEGATVALSLPVETQNRGAFLEVLTATECPNCLPVDLAAENLWADPELLAQGVISVQQHHPWAQGIDPFDTQDTWDRNAFYGAGDGSAGLPIRMVNGIVRVQGAGDGDIERITNDMRNETAPFLTETSKFSMHWLAADRVEAQEVSATLRVFITEDLTAEEAANIEILGMNYKHDLWTFVRIHQIDEPFYRVIRNIESAGSCADLGITEAGSYIDIDYVFDISWDTEWHENGMGMVAIAQDMATKEIFQVSQTPLP